MSGERTWELFRRGRAAAVLPYDPWTDQVVLIEQFRLAGACGRGGAGDGRDPRRALRRRRGPGGDGPARGQGRDGARDRPAASRSATSCSRRAAATSAAPCSPAGSARRSRGPDGLAGSGGLASEHEDIRVRVWPAEPRHRRTPIAGQFPELGDRPSPCSGWRRDGSRLRGAVERAVTARLFLEDAYLPTGRSARVLAAEAGRDRPGPHAVLRPLRRTARRQRHARVGRRTARGHRGGQGRGRRDPPPVPQGPLPAPGVSGARRDRLGPPARG